MEAVGVTPAILAIATAAIQSTKGVYEAVTAIRDGPEAVRRVANASNELLEMLNHFERFEPQLREILAERGDNWSENLHTRLQQCAASMNHIQEELRPYQQSSPYRIRDRMKRTVNYALGEKHIDSLREIIQTETGLLGACMGKLDIDLSISNAKRQNLLYSTTISSSQATATQFSMMKSALEQQNQEMGNLLATIEKNQQTLLQQEQGSVISHQRSFNGITQDIGHLGTQSFTQWSSLQDSSNKIRTDINQLPDMIATRVQESLLQLPLLQNLINEIQRLQIMSSSPQSQPHQLPAPPVESTAKKHSTLVEFNEIQGNAPLTNIAQILTRLYHEYAPFMDDASFIDSEAITHELTQLFDPILEHLNQEVGLHHDECPKQTKIKFQRECVSTALELLTTPKNLDFVPQHLHVARIESYLSNELASEVNLRMTEAVGRPQSSTFTAANVDAKIPPFTPFTPFTPFCPSTSSTLTISEPVGSPHITIAATSSERYSQYPNFRKRKARGRSRVTVLRPNYQDWLTSPKSSAEDFQPRTEIMSFGDSRGRIDIHFKQTKARRLRYDQGDDLRDDSGSREIFDAKFVLTPPASLNPRGQAVLELRQERWRAGSLVSAPSLSFRRFIPNDSEIFDFIEQDSLEHVYRLFKEGQVFINDRNAKGQSLLCAALNARSSQTAQFLVNKGADIDAVEDFDDYGYNGPIIEAVFQNFFERCDNDNKKANECLRIMLQAGTDPEQSEFNAEYGPYLNFLGCMLVAFPLDSVVLLLNLSRHFVNLDHIGDFAHGKPALALLGEQKPDGCAYGNFDYRTCPERVLLLINHGANVNASENDGSTCLHTFLSWEISKWKAIDYRYMGFEDALRREIILKDVLMILCTAGATVNAINDYGYSPLDVATAFANGRLWKEVLVECGYDIEKVCRDTEPDVGWSTAVDEVDGRHGSLRTGRTSTLSLAEYLAWREASGLSQQIKKFPGGEEGLWVVDHEKRIHNVLTDDEKWGTWSNEYESGYEDEDEHYNNADSDDEGNDQHYDESEDEDDQEDRNEDICTQDAQQTSTGQYRTKHKVG